MIRVIITGPSRKGIFPYRAEKDGKGLWEGRSSAPLMDTCLKILAMGEAYADEWAYLYREGRTEWDARCSVQWGATHEVRDIGFRERSHAEGD